MIILGLFLSTTGSLFSQVSQEKNDFDYGERLYNEGFFDLASLQFRNFIETYPSSPNAAKVQFLLGECAYSSQRFEEAQKAYLKLILLYPVSSYKDQAQFRIGECFEKMGKKEESVESYIRVNDFYPESRFAMESLYRSAGLSIETENLVKGETILRVLLDQASLGEYRSKGTFLLSEIYVKNEEYEKAIKLLRPILTHPIREEDEGEVHFRLGEIYEALGRFKESEEYYDKAKSFPCSDELKQKSWYKLGILYRMFGEETKALEALQQVTVIENNSPQIADAFFQIGVVKKQQNDFQGGSEAFNEAENQRSDPKGKMAARFERAKCYETLGRTSDAVDLYESIINDSSSEPILLKKCLLSLAYLFVEDKRYTEALQQYNRYLESFKEDPLICAVLFQKGKICLESLGFWDEGFTVFRQIWTDYPRSDFIPDARIVYAEGLERLGRVEEALQIYRMVLKHYPMTPSRAIAVDRVNKIEQFYCRDVQKGLAKFTSVAQRSLLDRDNTTTLFELGMVCFTDLRQYEEAIEFFTQYLSVQPESEKRDEILFTMGKSYEALFLKENDEEMLDRARNSYSSIITDYPESRWADDARLRLLHWQSMSTPEDDYQSYLQLFESYPQSNKRAEILYRMGMAAVEMDSLLLGLQIPDRHADDFTDSPYFEEILTLGGKIRMKLGDYFGADSIFQAYLEHFPEGRFLPEIVFYCAKTAQQKNDDSTAIAILEGLKRRFSFSSWADSALIYLGQLYLKTHDYQQCVPLYKAALQTDSLREWSASVGLQARGNLKRKHLLLGLAKAYQGLLKNKESKTYYFQYLLENKNTEDKVRVFSALSQIAEGEGKISRAEDYLTQILREVNSDSVAEAVGDLRFRLGRYDEAIEPFDRALFLTESEGKRMPLSAKIIISLLRQGKIPQAEVRMNIFSQSYKDSSSYREHMAEFFLEKGIAYIEEKEFEFAERALREVLQEYRDTNYGPQAEFEMGRVNLIINKIEDALKILTEMPEQYPNHPILAKVYLNLGVHYYQSKQYENALHAFKLAMDNQDMPEIVPIAMKYLIQLYDSIRMFDSALHLTREYIRRFPRAEDILQKRIQIGNLYMKLNEYDRAIEVLREVKRDCDSESEAEVQYLIGSCYNSMGRFQQAIFEFMKTKPTKLPWETTALYNAGQAYMKLQQPDQARKLFQKVIRKEGSTSDWGRFARQKIQDIDNDKREKE